MTFDYTAADLRERGQSYAEMSRLAAATEAKHRSASSSAPTPLARYAAQALMQASNCTARHWKKLSDSLLVAAAELEEKENA